MSAVASGSGTPRSTPNEFAAADDYDDGCWRCDFATSVETTVVG